MDPAVFGCIRVSQAEGESGLAAQRRILNEHGLGPEHAPSCLAAALEEAPARRRRRGAANRPPGAQPHRGSEDHRGAATPRGLTSSPLRRAWIPGTAVQPPGSCSTCRSPWPNGSGRPSGPGSRPGWTGGRPPALDSEKLPAVRGFLENGGSVSAAARTFGVSRPTVGTVRDGTYPDRNGSAP